MVNRRRLFGEEYKNIDSVIGTGTQYIDTGILGNGEIKFSCDFFLSPKTYTNGVSMALGGARSQTESLFLPQFRYSSVDSKLYATLGYKSSIWQINSIKIDPDDDTTHHLYIQYKDRNQQIILDNISSGVYSYAGKMNHALSIYLFKRHYWNDSDNVEPFCGGIKFAKITQNNILVRDYIPMEDNLGRIGLYDKCGSICPITGTPLYVSMSDESFVKGE